MEPGFYNMDCVEAMKQFPDKFFDLAIVDPPYGDAGGVETRTTVRGTVQQVQNSGTGSANGSTGTRKWNRFAGGTTFRKYLWGGYAEQEASGQRSTVKKS